MKKLVALTIFSSVLLSHLAEGKITPTHLQCEYLENPSVIDILNPRLSWVNVADTGEQGQSQTAWEIRVTSSKQRLLLGQSELWVKW